ncbi:hypothetical protein Pyn_27213 [Prunus yedoensis var. nudiflora]|uniref:Uncharacterized protein n=1 Tax=Prunus yedoensis var. nudiflora TaxID=2094558 RepID=A0A314UXL7_PRUYE|nr:hypothetical protein Pyn_27213 [Prunus yedoensis var. nudiflora]
MPTQQNKGPAAKQRSCGKTRVLQQNEGPAAKQGSCSKTDVLQQTRVLAKWKHGLLEYGSKKALGVHFSTHACYSDIEVVAHAIPAMHPCLPVEMTRLLYSM